jgi:hypothetical protein
MREELRKLESGKQAIESFAMNEQVSRLDAQVDRSRTLLGSGEIDEACPSSPHATTSKTKAGTGTNERNMPIPWCRFAGGRHLILKGPRHARMRREGGYLLSGSFRGGRVQLRCGAPGPLLRGARTQVQSPQRFTNCRLTPLPSSVALAAS